MDERNRTADARRRLDERYERLKQSRRTALPVAVVERFVEIDGATQGGLLSIQLFTIVIPLIIIGFAHFSGFAKTLMTWCGALAIGWVVIACTGAILWERNVHADVVIECQTAPDTGRTPGCE